MKLQKEVALYPGEEDSTSSRFDLMDDEISLKVSSNDVINSINVSPEGVQIQANRVNIAGATIFSQYETKADFNSTVASVKASANGREQIIYFSKASDSPPSANTTWVSKSTKVNNEWTLTRPKYSTSYPYLFTAKQSQTTAQKEAGSVCSCTDPVLDETTTVIDGGRIITNSIDANKIKAKSLTIGYFTDATASSINNTNAINAAEAYTDTYVTAVDSNGIKVHAASNANVNYALINSNGLDVYKSSTSVAAFGASSRVGTASGSRVAVSSSGLAIYNSSNVNLIGASGTSIRLGAVAANALRLELESGSMTFKQRNAQNSADTTVCYFSTNKIVLRNDAQLACYNTSGTARRLIGLSSSNNLVIGESGNKVYFYDDINTTSKISSEYLKTNTTSSKPNCYITSLGTITRTSTTSSRRFKHDIKPIENAELNPELLYDIPIVQFKYNNNHISPDDCRFNKDLPGFIAEDIADIYPIAADIEDGKVQAWNEQYLIPPMLALIQKQHKEIEKLKKEVSMLALIQKQHKEIEELKKEVQKWTKD